MICAPSEDWSAWASAQSDQSSLSAQRKLGSLATHWAHSEDSHQTGHMPRLIWVSAGCTCWSCHTVALVKNKWFYHVVIIQMSRDMTKPTIWLCAQQRLRSASASAQSDQILRCPLNGYLRTQSSFMQTAKTDQTGRMPRLIWVFAGHTLMLVLLCCGSNVLLRLSSDWMSCVTRKPVFGVFDQVRLEPACAATEARLKLEILDKETRDIILSRQRTTKVLIRLRGCTGWSEPLLFTYG